MTMKNARQQIPAPTLTPPTPSPATMAAIEKAQRVSQPTPQFTEKVETLPRVAILAGGQVVMTNPTIELQRHIFIGNNQTNKLTPKRAVIVGNALIVEELNLILPLEWALIRTES